LIVSLKDRFAHVITTDQEFDTYYLTTAAFDPNMARFLDFIGHELSEFVLEFGGSFWIPVIIHF
jgi:hypothetical protein